MESTNIAADVRIMQARLPECRAVKGLEYGTHCTRLDGLWRYVRVHGRAQWLLLRHCPAVSHLSDREIMREIRQELKRKS